MPRLRRSLRSLMRLVVVHHSLCTVGQWVRDVLILCGHGCTPFTHSQVYAKWKELPVEDMQAWTLFTAETQSSDRR